MKRWLVGALALGISLYVLLVSWPPVEQPEVLAEMHRRAALRTQALHVPEAQNGYRHPRFYAYWGPRVALRPSSSPLEPALDSWLEQEGRTHDARYQTARRRFESELPELLQALDRPAFAVHPQPGELALSWRSLKRLGEGLAALAEDRLEEGDADSFARLTLAVMRLGKNLAANGYWIDVALGQRLEMESIDQLLTQVEKHPLTPAAWSALAQGMPPLLPFPGELAESMACELQFSEVHAFDPPDPLTSTPGERALMWFPGAQQRELRILRNRFARLYLEARHNEVATSAPEPWSPSGWLLGRVNLSGGDMSFPRMTAIRAAHRRLFAGVCVLARLEAERGRTGVCPASLEGLQPLPGFVLTRDFRYRPGILLEALAPPAVADEFQFDAPSRLVSFGPDGAIFHLDALARTAKGGRPLMLPLDSGTNPRTPGSARAGQPAGPRSFP